jgi:hypothetical protein
VRQFRLREPELAPAFGHAVSDSGEEPAVLRMGKSLADPLERLVSSPRGCLTHISVLLYIAWMRYRRTIAVGSYFALAIVAVLTTVTAYEAATALGLIGIGSLPGEGPPGGDVVRVIAAIGLLAAALLAAGLAGLGPAAPAVSALLAPAAAAFMVAHFYSFDPYYAPSLIRYSSGIIAPAVVFTVVALAIAAGLLTRARPWLGLFLSAALVLACALIAFLAGIGK